MKPIAAIAIAFTLLIIDGCSGEKKESEADKKDHVLRQQFDVMQDAEAVKQTVNENMKAQEEQAAQIAGH